MIYYGSSGTLLVATGSFSEAVVDAARFERGSPFPPRGLPYRTPAASWSGLGARCSATRHMRCSTRRPPTPPGANGIFVLPFASGRLMPDPDPDVRAAIVGLRLDHDRADIWRAILESFGWMLMDGLRRLETGRLGGGRWDGCPERHLAIHPDRHDRAAAVTRSGRCQRAGRGIPRGPRDRSGRWGSHDARYVAGSRPGSEADRPGWSLHARYLGLLDSWLALDSALSRIKSPMPALA